MERKKD